MSIGVVNEGVCFSCFFGGDVGTGVDTVFIRKFLLVLMLVMFLQWGGLLFLLSLPLE